MMAAVTAAFLTCRYVTEERTEDCIKAALADFRVLSSIQALQRMNESRAGRRFVCMGLLLLCVAASSRCPPAATRHLERGASRHGAQADIRVGAFG